jgi:hypothetical protein
MGYFIFANDWLTRKFDILGEKYCLPPYFLPVLACSYCNKNNQKSICSRRKKIKFQRGEKIMTAVMLKFDHFHNPLDVAETVMLDRDIAFDRSGDGDLLAEASGVWGKYSVWFAWQEEHGSLTISCAIQSKLPKQSLMPVYALLAHVNERLWMGHFSIESEESVVHYRHTVLVKDADGQSVSAEVIQQLLDIAVQECERFYPALQAVVWGGKSPKEALEYSLFETIGEA